mgnify:CR=1 FL=1
MANAKPKRLKLKHKEVNYDLSEAQYLMLSRGKIEAEDPMTWRFEQRITSLVRQGLFCKRNGAFKRTKLGSTVWQTIADRRNAQGVA